MTSVTGCMPSHLVDSTASDLNPPGDGSLLPDPAPSPGGGLTDAMSSIYAVLAELGVIDVRSGQESVSENETLQNAALAREQAALKRQEANEPGSGRGLFSSLGHLFSDAVGDLAHGHVWRAVGDAESDIGDAWNSPRLWSDLAKGLKAISDIARDVGAVAKLVPGAGAIVASIAGVVDEAATVGVDLADLRGEYFAAEVIDAGADAKNEEHHLDSLQRAVGGEIDDLKAADESGGRALDAIRGAMRIDDKTLLETASITVRG